MINPASRSHVRMWLLSSARNQNKPQPSMVQSTVVSPRTTYLLRNKTESKIKLTQGSLEPRLSTKKPSLFAAKPRESPSLTVSPSNRKRKRKECLL